MQVEKSCLYRFVDKVQDSFSEGDSLDDVLKLVSQYHRFARRAYKGIGGPVHKIVTSQISLTYLVHYEYLRHQGLPLPNSNNVIQRLLPIKMGVRFIISCGKIDPSKLNQHPKLLEHQFQW